MSSPNADLEALAVEKVLASGGSILWGAALASVARERGLYLENIPAPPQSVLDAEAAHRAAKDADKPAKPAASRPRRRSRPLAVVEAPEPAPDLAATLDTLRDWFGKYLVLSGAYDVAVLALWAAHTWIPGAFYTTPRLVVSSPVPGSGKTRVLELLGGVVCNPKMTVNSTTAAIYRRISKTVDEGENPPALLYDEVDALFGARPTPQAEDMRALLNAGYKRGATVDRCEGDSHEVKEFPVFAPVALAGLAGHMPDTITTRAIVLEMKKRLPGETVASYRERRAYAEIAPAKAALAAWARNAEGALADVEPDMPRGVVDRPAEVWEPLIVIADAAGGHWPETARAACRDVVFAPVKRPPSQGVELLADIRQIMGHDPDSATDEATRPNLGVPLDRIRTTELVESLNGLRESGWLSADKGRGLTARRVSQILAGYDVRPVAFREGSETVKGYTVYATDRHGKPFQAGLGDAWARYLPPDAVGKTGNSGNFGNAPG